MKDKKKIITIYFITSIALMFIMPFLMPIFVFFFKAPLGLFAILFVLFINAFIASVVFSRYNYRRITKNYKNYFEDTNPSCNNDCVEEGNDVFAQKREEGKIAFRNQKKANNAKKNNGKIYCIHCGAELLYGGNKCDWCGEYQDK